MELRELIGSTVWIKRRSLSDNVGYIISVLQPVILESIASSVTASTFRIKLRNGEIVETTGVNILRIDHPGFVLEAIKSRFAKARVID